MIDCSRLSQERVHCIFADFLDCNSAPGMDDLFIYFWSFLSSVISVYFVIFIDLWFVAHLYAYARLVTTFLYLFLVFLSLDLSCFLSLFTTLFIHACTDFHEGSIIISSGLWALMVHSWSLFLAILTLFYTALCFWVFFFLFLFIFFSYLIAVICKNF